VLPRIFKDPFRRPKNSPFARTVPAPPPKLSDTAPSPPDPRIQDLSDRLEKQDKSSKSLIGKLKDRIESLVTLAKKGKAVKDVATKTSAWSKLLSFAGTGLGLSATAASGAGIAIPIILMLLQWRRKRKSVKVGSEEEIPALKPEQAQNTLQQQQADAVNRIKEVRPEAETKSEPRQIPMRDTTELHQLLQLRKMEGRDPLLDASFGMFVEDEIESYLGREETSDENRRLLRGILGRSHERVNRAAPLSV